MNESISSPWFRLALLAAVAVGGWILVPESGAVSGSASQARASKAPQEASPPATSAVAGLPSFAELAERVLPAVVGVEARTIERAEEGLVPMPFQVFPPRFPERSPRNRPREFRQDSGGSGFLVSSEGLIVTNHHVIEGATSVIVRFDSREYEAKVRGSDPSTDLALLKIEAEQPLPYLGLGDSDRLRVGDWVMAVGNPLLLDHSVTVGVVSAKGRAIGITADSAFENFIQTDAAINRGNSGGPLVDLEGRVIGIATAMKGGAENIGFAIPVNTLKAILPQLKEKGRVSRGYLGVTVGNLTPELSEAFGTSGVKGVLVQEVREDGPAMKAGLEHGDIILQVDGKAVSNSRELIDFVSSRSPGTQVEIQFMRQGRTLTKKVTLAERPLASEEEPGGDVAPEAQELEWLGLEIADLSEVARRQFGIPKGVSGVLVIDLAPSSVLYDQGLRGGDVILEVNGEPVTSAAEFYDRVRAVRKGQLLRLYIARFDPATGRPLGRSFLVVRVP